MIRISKLADYGVIILCALAECRNDVVSASIIADRTSLPEPTVAKILKLLTKGGLINSTRGIRGGYALAKNPREISIKNIIHAIDGPIMITACVDGAEPDCTLSGCCTVRGRWDGVNSAIQDALEGVTLADMLGESAMTTTNEDISNEKDVCHGGN
ncbi:MAG: SUF system Fe-S cluster assembly regulator [Alphaproteobacteria bacterium]